MNIESRRIFRRFVNRSEAVFRTFDEHGIGPVSGALYAILHAAAIGNIRSRNGRGIGPQIGIVVIGQSHLARQVAGQGFGRALTLRIGHFQNEFVIRGFIVNLRDHRNKLRNIERQGRFARNRLPRREPERAERLGHAAGIHEVQLGSQTYRCEHFGRQSRRVDRNREARNRSGSRHADLDRHRIRDLLRLVDVTAVQCNGRSRGQVTREGLGGALPFRIGHLQDELMVRGLFINRCNHRDKRRNIECQGRFARNRLSRREPERPERLGHAAGIHEIQLGSQTCRCEHFGRQSRRVDRNRETCNRSGSRHRYLDRHRIRDLLRLVDVTAVQCNSRNSGGGRLIVRTVIPARHEKGSHHGHSHGHRH